MKFQRDVTRDEYTAALERVQLAAREGQPAKLVDVNTMATYSKEMLNENRALEIVRKAGNQLADAAEGTGLYAVEAAAHTYRKATRRLEK